MEQKVIVIFWTEKWKLDLQNEPWVSWASGKCSLHLEHGTNVRVYECRYGKKNKKKKKKKLWPVKLFPRDVTYYVTYVTTINA